MTTHCNPTTGPACVGRPGLGGTLELRVYREQRIADVPFPDPCVILVTRGHKTLCVGEQCTGAGAGEVLFINAGVTAAMRNEPDADGLYAATCVAIAADLVRAHAAARQGLRQRPPRGRRHAGRTDGLRPGDPPPPRGAADRARRPGLLVSHQYRGEHGPAEASPRSQRCLPINATPFVTGLRMGW